MKVNESKRMSTYALSGVRWSMEIVFIRLKFKKTANKF